MASLLELCRQYFDTENLYEVLNANKKSTDKEGFYARYAHRLLVITKPFESTINCDLLCLFRVVRKAYYVLSMKYHPDKVADKDKTVATEKFKVISRIHALLSDADKRKLYDDTGKLWTVL